MKSNLRSAGSLVVALLVACESSPTGPDAQAELSAMIASSAAQSTATSAIGLDGLFRQAIAVIAQNEGRETAAGILAQIKRLEHAIADARASGNDELARRLHSRLQHDKASIIVRTLGTDVVVRILGTANDQLEALRQRIRNAEAEGAEVPARLKHVLRQAQSAIGEARGLLAQGQPAAALLEALYALELLNW